MFILHSKAFGVPGFDTPYPKFKDSEGLINRNAKLKSLGFRGAFAIHPD